MKIALTGATGLVGSRFFDLLKTKHEIIPVSSSFGVNITDDKKLTNFLKEKNPSLILHLAAKTNVDSCETDKNDDLNLLKKQKVFSENELRINNLDTKEWKGSVSAFGINVIGTKNLSDFSKKTGIRMIYVSTDFVFDGTKNGEYDEGDTPCPINWYGQTKYWGEKEVGEDGLITRISYPYGYQSAIKKDLVWTLVDLLTTKDEAKLVIDQILTPTFIDDIVKGLDFLIEKGESGLIDLVGNNFLSPYEIGIIIAREWGVNESKIETTTRDALYKGRAPRPFKVMLKNDKLKNLGFTMSDFYENIKKIKK